MSEYWKKRATELEKVLNKKGVASNQEIEQVFDKAEKEIQDRIDLWYLKLAKNNNLDMAGAKQLLKANELKEFKWDVDTYIKYGEENAINANWLKELNNASAKVHISRLEAIKLHTQQSLEKAFSEESNIIENMLKSVYTDGYGRSIYAGQIEALEAFKIEVPSADVNKVWAADGKKLSERITEKKISTIGNINQAITTSVISNTDNEKTIKDITEYVKNRISVAKSSAKTLNMTEQAYIGQKGQQDAYEDLDVEKVEIIATLDQHTTNICQNMDGKLVEMKDVEPGVTTPPFHANCRSTTMPYFSEDFTIGETRAAKNSDGKTYKVPANMKYAEWKEKYYK